MQTRKALPIALFSLSLFLGALTYTAFGQSPEVTYSAPAAGLELQGIAAASGSAVEGTVYTIDPTSSQASFSVDELLFGRPNTVVGTTSNVSGQILVNPVDTQTLQVSTIQIDAGSLATDSRQRDGQINRFVLAASQYPTIAFAPSVIVGLPDATTVGGTYPVQISGDLTIKNTIQPVTFVATVTQAAPNEIAGSATTSISLSGWGISIPQVPQVAGISDEVKLGLNFRARSA
jgi:polyisoprenoid-binding protein YceI